MFVNLFSCVFVLEMLKGDGVESKAHWCDWSRSVAPEGIPPDQTAAPWLGVLRVHIHEGPKFRIAVTGIVLVKKNYAIGNADDIARIPRRTFKQDSRAMFVHTNGSLWFCNLVDFKTHPDYELDSLNSIALVELDPGQLSQFPIKPVCWPPSGYNVTTDTYVFGYTDENEVLQKFIHKVQHVKPDLCTEFYVRAGLLEPPLTPVHVRCASSTSQQHCVWENGMALVGNNTGLFMLLGLSLRGPGCSAPARFISLAPYFSWIESATEMQGVQALRSEQAEMKTAFNQGSHRKPSITYVPVHELFGSDAILRSSDAAGHKKHDFAHYHPGAIIQVDDDFYILKINDTRIDLLWSGGLQDKYGNCSMTSLRQVYRDALNLKFPGRRTPVEIRYKISLFDVEFSNYTCVSIKLEGSKASHAELDHAYDIEEDSVYPRNIQEKMRHYPLYTLSRIIDKTSKSHLAPSPIQSPGKTT